MSSNTVYRSIVIASSASIGLAHGLNTSTLLCVTGLQITLVLLVLVLRQRIRIETKERICRDAEALMHSHQDDGQHQ